MQIDILAWDVVANNIGKALVSQQCRDIETGKIYCESRAKDLASVLRKYIYKKSEINRNGDFTQEGRQKEFVKARRVAQAEIDKIFAKHMVGMRIEQIERQTSNVIPNEDANDIVSELKCQKMEDRLRGMKDYEVNKILLDACRTGDADDQMVIRTIFGAHKLFPLLDPSKIDEGKKIIAKRVYPELMAELYDLRAIKYTIDRLFGAAREVLN